MVKVGKYETFTEYLKAYRIQGTLPKLSALLIGIDWLRLGIIVFGYLLLRPLIIRQAARYQTNQLEKEDARLKKEAAEAQKANKATGKDDIQWGQGVKTRQHKIEEQRLQGGEESDSDDLEDLLPPTSL